MKKYLLATLAILFIISTPAWAYYVVTTETWSTSTTCATDVVVTGSLTIIPTGPAISIQFAIGDSAPTSDGISSKPELIIKDNAALIISGQTTWDSIVLTSTDEASGNLWGGILLKRVDSSSQINTSTIKYTETGIYLRPSATAYFCGIYNNLITRFSTSGIYIDDYASPNISGNTILFGTTSAGDGVYGIFSAGAVMAMVTIVLFFLVLQKQWIAGSLAGALKQ